ncbi:MAG: glutamine amidotransferase [Proteobacteria bacterium]|nr:glutamine amidotransferase [Pseudomonadota bacterium]
MARRVVLITHNDSPRDDRVSARLAALGYALDWRQPYAGDALGEPDETIAATVLYGGGDPADAGDWHSGRYPFIAAETAWVRACMAQHIPTLGICLGGGIVSHALGAAIGPPDHGLHEFGYYKLKVTAEGRAEIPDGMVVTQSHYHGFGLPDGAVLLAASEAYPVQAYRYGEITYALQFHPEVTPAGFRRWQDRDWAPWGKPGVQTREQQDALRAVHDPAQAAWIEGFVDRLMAKDT